MTERYSAWLRQKAKLPAARRRLRPWIPCTLLVLVCGLSIVHAIGQGNDLIPDIPVGPVTVELVLLADLDSRVIDITNAGDGSGRLFLVSPEGVVRIFHAGVVSPTPFLDVPADPPDRAMSSLVFHPDYSENGRLYVITGEATAVPPAADYDPPQNDTSSAFDNLLVEYQVDPADPDSVDLGSKRELLRVHQAHRLHNLGDAAFGKDGYLYITSGDGGTTRAGTPIHYNTNAQLTSNPYGAILRIDVDSIGPDGRYAIPPDNPFADGAGGNVPEIFAWGLRNPWRISTDLLIGELYTGVNGDFTIEQVFHIDVGKNYGWDVKEGSYLWDPDTGDASVDPSPDPAYTSPLAEWDHNNSDDAYGSAISGFVYRGSTIPALYGKHLSIDYVAGNMIATDPETGALELVSIDPAGAQLEENQHITWGEDENGELYIGGLEGKVMGLVPANAADVAGRVPDGADVPEAPLELTKEPGGDVTLSWGASCQADDGDYAVYEGSIGNFSSHAAALCGTGGETNATITAGAGDTYYLVTPVDGLREGSLGTDSEGNDRPPALVPCLLRSFDPCG